MKTKLLFLLAGLAVSGLVLNGCYTQMARPDREDEPSYAEESESAEVVAGESEEASAQKEADIQRDDHRRTNVYIYGGGGYGSPWYPYGYPYWYDPYPRSGFYVSIGYGYYDQWNWCGTAWNWYDPWCHDYYSGFWGPSYGWRPAYYYPPYYYPYYVVSGNDGAPAKKRSIGRRGSSVTDDLPSGTYSTGSTRGTLFRPASSTYTRDNDGSYRRTRRDEAGSGSTVQRAGSNDKSTSKQGQPATNSRRVSKRGSGNDGNSNRTTVSRGSSGDSSGRSGHSGSSGSSGSGGSVSKPSGSGSSGGSAPRSSSGSSSSGSSSGRRTRN